MALVQSFWKKNVLLPIFYTNLLQWSTKVLILGRLCAISQPWKSSLKVGGARNAILGERVYFIAFLKKKFQQKNFRGKNM